MPIVCVHCGGLNPGGQDLVQHYLQRCEADPDRMVIIGHRVPPKTAARLLGCSEKTLERYRKCGIGPQWSSIPVAGSRVSYTLEALAAFEEAHTHGESWDMAA